MVDFINRFNEKMAKYRVEPSNSDAKPEFDVNNKYFLNK